MSELEAVIRHPLFQFVFSGFVVLLQLYLISKLDPINQSLKRHDAENQKQWNAIGDIEAKLNTLQGEHNAHHHRGGKK